MEITFDSIIGILGLFIGGGGGAFFTWRWQKKRAKAEAESAEVEAAEAQWPALPSLGSESPHSPAWGPEVLSICLYAALPLSGLAWDLHPPPGLVLFEGRNQPVFFVIVSPPGPSPPNPRLAGQLL